ncbi:MAG: ArsR family transcriptional regulator [Planctomycetes bacterium]|jgi:DNA-binding transcriptional ArsR family regulator|nr:ArsR family transcriptional regulator [Planctomycetota bacterium]
MARKPRVGVDWFDMRETPYRASRILKSLGNPKAYSLVRLLLEEGVLNVTEMCAALKRSQVAVSKVLRSLRELDLVRYQKEKQFTVYTVKDPSATKRLCLAAEALAERIRRQND